MELISVLIPTYNVELFVEDAINSIIAQSYKNIEIIIVDDASIDKTFEILSKLRDEDGRIKLFRNSKNKGIAETLNFALTQASGKLIARMDGDDISHPKRIEKLYHFLECNPDIMLVGSGIRLINQFGTEIQKALFPTDFSIIKNAIKYSSPILHIWMTYKQVYIQIGNYRFPGVEDYDFLLRCIEQNLKITNINECVYDVRIREGNTISAQGLRQRKAFNYVRKLYLKGEILRDDINLRVEFEKEITTSNFLNRLHKKSSDLLNSYIGNKRNPIAIFYLALAIFFSPYYQFQYLFFRFKYKQITLK